MMLLANYVTITKEEQTVSAFTKIFEVCLYLFLFSYFCRPIKVAVFVDTSQCQCVKKYAGSFRKVGFSAANLLKKSLFTLNIATAFV